MNDEGKNRFLVFILAFFILLAIFIRAGHFKINELVTLEEGRVENIRETIADLPLEAKAISVYDLTQSKKIFGKDDSVALPIASLAKTMTVITALNKEKGQTVLVSGAALSQAGDYDLRVGEKWASEDLAKLTLISSSNDGAYALYEGSGVGEDTFLERMNTKAQKIGMENTFFLNVTGLDLEKNEIPTQPGGFASAMDLNLLANYAMLAYPEIFSVTTEPEISLNSQSGFSYKFKNTNTIIGKIPNLIFSKTGFTELAGGNLTIIFKDKNNNLVAVTILGSTYEGRFTDMEKIVEVLYNL